MKGGRHQAAQHRTLIPGVEAVALASDWSFPRHAHDGFGIGVLHAGAHRSWSGIGPVEAVAGDVITVNPGEIHDGEPVRGAPRSWRMLYIDPGILGQVLSEDLRGEAEIARPVLRDRHLADQFAEIFTNVTEAVPDAFAAEEGVLRLLARLLSRYGSRPLLVAGPPPPVKLALLRLTEAPEQPATLAELAALSGVSRFQLLRGFARATGMTPHAYLVQQRVRLARRLLAADRRPAEVAAEAGFADQSHLTRAFRRQFGVTPARYRAAVV